MSKAASKAAERGGKGKKKFVPQNENTLAKQEYLELDEEEVEHRRQLDMKYRDRAKERRDRLIEDEEEEDEEPENFDDENLVVKEGEEEYYTTTKGLDFDLLKKQKDKEARENTIGQLTKIQELIKKRDGVLPGSTEKKELKAPCRSILASNIQKVLFREEIRKEGKRNIFKANNCYEFDVNFDFGNTLPKLVIRSRGIQDEEQKPVSAEIGENVLTKMTKIMTYIKTGKKADHKKQLIDNKLQKSKEPQVNPISTLDMSEEEDDEDSIFPDAKKKVKRDEGPKSSLLFPEVHHEEKGEQKTMKGIFESVKTAKQDGMDVEEEEDILNIKQITEKNKELLEQMARKKAEEKLAHLQQKDDGYYMECFPEDAPELEDLKNQQKQLNNARKGKSKKNQINKQFDKVTKIMTEKRGGGGPKDDG